MMGGGVGWLLLSRKTVVCDFGKVGQILELTRYAYDTVLADIVKSAIFAKFGILFTLTLWNFYGELLSKSSAFKMSIKSRACRTPVKKMQCKIMWNRNKSCRNHNDLFLCWNFAWWPVLIFCMHATFRKVLEKVIQ